METRKNNSESEKEVVITRLIEAPRDLVFKAWTDPTQLAAWWGPRGFTTTCQLDARAKGAYRIVMHGLDGTEYPMMGTYLEITEPEKIVYTADLSGHNAAWKDAVKRALPQGSNEPHWEGHVTVTFEAQGQKTLLVIRTQFESVQMRNAMSGMGMNEGWGQSLERMESLLNGDRGITITRILKAPRELVFSAWTDPQHLIHWWGPNGFSHTFHEIDVKPGGIWKFTMHGPDGTNYASTNIFREISKPERIVIDHAEDPKFRMTVTFDDLGRETRLTLYTRFESIDQWNQAKTYAVEGNRQSLDRLEARLLALA